MCREAEVSDLIWAQAEAKLSNFMVANSFATGHGDTFDDLLRELEWQVRALRERRAAVPYDESPTDPHHGGKIP